ncbi:hypothetical protein AYO44_10995 [Planctomycetaceae bacterium SCGC AG-212-F19]|nr:hypothetical protein AYO44_10995 [Planctomycetaceae bacterium SCGC AG-212-F19]
MDASDDLLRRCQRGDQAALAELVRSYQDRIFRLASRVVSDAGLAEEATAQAFVKIWTHAGQWRGQASAGTWIYRIAVRAVLDVQRGQRRWWRRWSGSSPSGRSCSRLAVVDPRPTPAEQFQQRDERDRDGARIQEALRQLPEADRALVHLFYFEDRGLAEIESILGVPRANLKMRLARARQRLRTFLESDDGNP